eukprot:766788-Prymnesium_polylepis.1
MTLGCGYKGRREILWTDGSEPGARRGTPLYETFFQETGVGLASIRSQHAGRWILRTSLGGAGRG